MNARYRVAAGHRSSHPTGVQQVAPGATLHSTLIHLNDCGGNQRYQQLVVADQ